MNATPDSQYSSSSDESVFASPPEPCFNSKDGMSSAQVLLSIKTLADENKALMNKGKDASVSLLLNSPKCVLFIFSLASHLELSPDVQYRALDLFCRFLPLHINELHSYVFSSSHKGDVTWEQVKQRLQHQVTLRAVSAIQVASKLSSHQKLAGLNKVSRVLSLLGYRYSASSLVQSEIRLLRTLNYYVNTTTPMVFVEPLLESISQSKQQQIPVNLLYGVSLKIIEYIYLDRELVYKNLRGVCNMAAGCPEAVALENNLMFLTAAAISTASFFLSPAVSDDVASHIATCTNIPVDDILDFSSILIEGILTPALTEPPALTF